ncbi:hypothetical protein MZK49_06860 [Ensifer sesbaniae]|nr:hypothetical protein [Ensifer sesbaniae]
MSISEGFFVIGQGPEMGKDRSRIAKRKELTLNDGMEVERAGIRVGEMLLSELVHSLLVRGALKEEDVAGALLRTAERAWGADRIARDDGDISPSHAGLVELTIEEWDGALGLKPQLYALRKLHKEWTAADRKGQSPLHPRRVVEHFSDNE